MPKSQYGGGSTASQSLWAAVVALPLDLAVSAAQAGGG